MIFEKQVVNMYKGMIHTRCDDEESVFYFHPEQFSGLKAEPHSFKASAGHTLQGWIYAYENPIPKRLIVFDHGFGGGHLAYMKEIELLCRHGYLVFAYDHTGCMRSGGASPNGLSQSLCDLNDCFLMLKSDERFTGYDFYVMGHSWGAFSTLNIAALHPEVKKIVAISGFVSVTEMVGTFFSGALKGYRRAILSLEKESNPKFFDFNAVESLKSSSVKALLIYSENDPLCTKHHYDVLRSGLDGVESVSFILEKNKLHNPNYTESAVKYLGEFSKSRTKLLKKKNVTQKEKESFVASFDWNRMTEQDVSVWNAVFEHFDR